MTSRIFVSIACFMDPDVVETVRDLFRTAAAPERISVGICLQLDPAGDQHVELDAMDGVRVDRIPYTEARGPIYARYRCEQLLGDENYFLQIDCHSRFFPEWDRILLEEFARCRALREKVVISHYPININNMTNPAQLDRIGHIGRFRHVGPDAIKMHGGLILLPPQPQPAFGISAAMLFMESKTKRQIPFDPRLHYGLHAPEQFLYSARLWTHGYTVMTPTRHAVATEYLTNRERIPKEIWQHYLKGVANWPQRTWTKVKYLLELDALAQVDAFYKEDCVVAENPFGMGRERTLVDYYKYMALHEQLLTHFPYYRQRHGEAPQS